MLTSLRYCSYTPDAYDRKWTDSYIIAGVPMALRSGGGLPGIVETFIKERNKSLSNTRIEIEERFSPYYTEISSGRC